MLEENLTHKEPSRNLNDYYYCTDIFEKKCNEWKAMDKMLEKILENLK